jgi:peptidoglycan/LPS O-acetylase OafA/YrhL
MSTVISASETTHRANPGYRPDIDGLRALAVLAVVGFHAFPGWVRGGFIGVDIFFVISGFLISNIIFANLEAGSFTFRKFYARRIKRIFPALIIVLLFCLAVGHVVLLADEYKQLGKHVAAGIGFVANVVLWKEAGYFDKSAELKPLLHLWSLGIEEQFYLFWPPLVLLFYRRRPSVGTLLLVTLVVSFAINIAEISHHPVATFYLPFSRMWELLVGCGLSYISLTSKGATGGSALVRKLEGNLTSATGFLFILAALVGLSKDTDFPGWAALLPTAGAVLLISAGQEAWLNRHIFSNRAAVFVGLISYPLYLWHWPLLSFARIVLSDRPSLPIVTLIVAISVLLAWLTYVIVEKPIRSGQTFRVPLLLAGTAVVVGCTGAYIDQTNGMGWRFRTFAPSEETKNPTEHANVATITSPETGNDLAKTIPKAPIAKAPTQTAEQILAHQEQQFLWIENGDNATPACLARFSIANSGHDDKCEIFDIRREPTVVLLGDSHANAMYLGLAKYYSARGDNLVNLGRGGCLPFWGVNTEIRPNGVGTDCEKFMDGLLDYSLMSPAIHTVLLADFGTLYIDGGDRPVISSADPANKAASQVYERELRSTIARFRAAKKKVILVLDYPDVAFDPHSCLARPSTVAPVRKVCAADQSEVDARMGPYRRLMYNLLGSLPGLFYIDVTPVFCDGTNCWAKKGDLLLYRNRDHLSHDGSLYFAARVRVAKVGLNPISSRALPGAKPQEPPSVLSVNPP